MTAGKGGGGRSGRSRKRGSREPEARSGPGSVVEAPVGGPPAREVAAGRVAAVRAESFSIRARNSALALARRPVFVFVLVALALRLPFLPIWGLWLDEVFVRNKALESFGAIFRTLHFVHFFWVKAFHSALGTETALRLPSALFGAASVPLAFGVGARMFDRATGTVFALFVAAIPYFVVYSIDANYYSHMMFWVLAALFFAGRLAATHRATDALAIGAVGAICFFVHPFSALFFASLGIWLLVEAIFEDGYYRSDRLPVVLRSHRTRVVAVPAALIAAAVVAGAILRLSPVGGIFFETTSKFLGMLAPGKSPTNIEFSYAFFDRYFRRIGPAFFEPYGSLATVGAYLAFGLFLLGIGIVAARRGRLVPLFVVPFLLTFAIVFNLDAGRFFAIRYISYLVPLYWLAISVALAAAARRIGAPALAFAGGLLVFSLPQYVHMVRADGRAWDAVMPKVAELQDGSEPFVQTNWAEQAMLPYYLNKYGLDPKRRMSLDFAGDRAPFLRQQFKRLCARTPGLWFVATSAPWLDDESGPTRLWAERRLEKIGEGPSVFDDANSVVAYRWTMGGRFLVQPDSVRIAAGFGADGVRREEVLFETTGRYRFDLMGEPATAGAVPGSPPTLSIDGVLVPLEFSAIEDRETWTGFAGVDEGRRRLEVRRGGDAAGRAFKLGEIAVFHSPADGRRVVPAFHAYELHPSLSTTTPEVDGEPLLRFARASHASYRFGIPLAGRYRVEVEARHDGALDTEPIAIEVRLNGMLVGTLAFENDPAGFRTFGLPVDLGRGDFRVTVRFLNEDNGVPRFRRNAWVRSVAIRPWRDGDRDERAVVPRKPAKPLPIVDTETKQIREGWLYGAETEHEYEFVKRPTGDVVFKLLVPPESDGVELAGPEQPVPADRLVYFSGMLRAAKLRNHSVNMLTRLFDEKGEPLPDARGEALDVVVNQEGISGTTDWVRFVQFLVVPPEAKSYRPIFWAYANGRRPSEEVGEAWFGGLMIETYD